MIKLEKGKVYDVKFFGNFKTYKFYSARGQVVQDQSEVLVFTKCGMQVGKLLKLSDDQSFRPTASIVAVPDTKWFKSMNDDMVETMKKKTSTANTLKCL